MEGDAGTVTRDIALLLVDRSVTMLADLTSQVLRGLALDGSATVLAVGTDEETRRNLHARLASVTGSAVVGTVSEVQQAADLHAPGVPPDRQVLVVCPLEDELATGGWFHVAKNIFVLAPNRVAHIPRLQRLISRWRNSHTTVPTVFVEMAGEGEDFAPVKLMAEALEGAVVRPWPARGVSLRTRASLDILNQQEHRSPATELASADDGDPFRRLARRSTPPRFEPEAAAPAPPLSAPAPAATLPDQAAQLDLRSLVNRFEELRQRQGDLVTELERLHRLEQELTRVEQEMRSLAQQIQTQLGAALSGLAAANASPMPASDPVLAPAPEPSLSAAMREPQQNREQAQTGTGPASAPAVRLPGRTSAHVRRS